MMFFSKLSIYRDMHYLDVLTLKIAFNLLFYSGFFITISLILRFVSKFSKPSKTQYNPLDIGASTLEPQNDIEKGHLPTFDQISDNRKPQIDSILSNSQNSTKLSILISGISKLLAFLSCFIIAFIPSLFSASGRIPVFLAIFWALTVFSFQFCHFLYSAFSSAGDNSKNFSKSKWQIICWAIQRNFKMLTQIYKAKIMLPLLILGFLSFCIPLITSGLCVSVFSDKYGFYWLEVRRVSSTFTRWFEIQKVCPPGPPCHIYATVPEDTSTSFFLNVHTHSDIQEITILYEEKEQYLKTNATSNQKKGEVYEFKEVENIGKRNVHSIYIDKLKESTEYYLEIYYDDKVQAHKYYKTLPGGNSQQVKIAMGGDIGSNYTVRDMNIQVAKYNPDILVIAGDASYDDGLATCYYGWDIFFNYFEEMFDNVGRLIPFVIGIGNHDIGYNALAFPDLEINEKGPLFYLYFPQHLPRNQDGIIESRVPALTERQPYFYHLVGNTIQLSLDSGYMTPYEGKQKEWIQEIVNIYPDKARFANYHVPVYPACFKSVDDERAPLLAEEHWIPLFENLKFMCAFENHAHFYKRTVPLLKGKEDPKGVLYLGDGAWGVVPNYCKGQNKPRKNELKIYKKAESLNHVWILTINQTVVKYEPLGINGELIEDPLYQNISDYSILLS